MAAGTRVDWRRLSMRVASRPAVDREQPGLNSRPLPGVGRERWLAVDKRLPEAGMRVDWRLPEAGRRVDWRRRERRAEERR